jgi:hypothetical protein
MRRQISIPDEINKYLEKLPNASGYIVQLIESDVNNNKPLTKAEVVKIIQEYCSSDLGNKKDIDISDLKCEDSLNSFINL